ncbi:hypothetical protein [Schaalia suimastitidis]|nr:hypothetical protein [Schaalia suimastitidis]
MTAWVADPATQSVHKVDLDTKEVTTKNVGVALNETVLVPNLNN